MARKVWNVAGNRQFGRLAKSAGVRRNPHEYAGTGATRQEKTPTENGWGFVVGGGWLTAELGSRSVSSDRCWRLQTTTEHRRNRR